jgi:hypothetical protein
MDPGQNKLTSNIIGSENKWNQKSISIMKVGTDEQLADIFTKGLQLATFAPLWQKIMGW